MKHFAIVIFCESDKTFAFRVRKAENQKELRDEIESKGFWRVMSAVELPDGYTPEYYV